MIRLYSESVAHFDKVLQEALMTEHPHGRFKKSEIIPKGNYLDLGFENLGLSNNEKKLLYKAIYHTGCIIPKTSLKIRCDPGDVYLVEPIDGTELATLPDHWKQAIYVMQLGEKDEFVFIGKLVRQEQITAFDRTTLTETPDGWEL